MLVPNWKDVITKAWSVRLMTVAAILSGLEVALPMLQPQLGVPDHVFAAMAGLITAAALFARVLAQSNVEDVG